MQAIRRQFKTTFYVCPIFKTPKSHYLDENDLSKFEIEHFICNCNKPSKRLEDSEGVYVCDYELSKDKKEEVFKKFFKYFLKNEVCSEDFFVEMEQLTGRKLYIDEENLDVAKKNPLSFLFYFTLSKCYSQVNWYQILDFKSGIDMDSFSDNILSSREICGNICFSDDHLTWMSNNKADVVSTLIRVEDNLFVTDRLLYNLKAFKKDLFSKEKGFPNPKIHCRSLNDWITLTEKLNKNAVRGSASAKITNPYSFVCRLKYRNNLKHVKNEKEIVSINMCSLCGMNKTNMPVSDLLFNADFFFEGKRLVFEENSKKRKAEDELELLEN